MIFLFWFSNKHNVLSSRSFKFPPDHFGQVEVICTSQLPGSKDYNAVSPSQSIFGMIHGVGRGSDDYLKWQP